MRYTQESYHFVERENGKKERGEILWLVKMCVCVCVCGNCWLYMVTLKNKVESCQEGRQRYAT